MYIKKHIRLAWPLYIRIKQRSIGAKFGGIYRPKIKRV